MPLKEKIIMKEWYKVPIEGINRGFKYPGKNFSAQG